ncbi:aminotransferase class I/II-fold pyridoxal phosphate-dependent enzyme [Corynebacterium lizhenjunii]|uniref:aminotransferase class I/II-fold pyridoxal phosphate-dependent enzyme n=1 Tax=Corynebacterium lizhenjunii TaxID=2709394 RepID=UPI0013EC5C07|nr:aminotransferase class I/II-fold pyridoxal phosphate-dependent enzyme [Corynebacterium lizhenjunii]
MTVNRLRPFGETIFTTMSALAAKHEAINLGQGFPDTDGPARMLEIARAEIAAGNNQYAPLRGQQVLLDAITSTFGVPESHVLVTVGATEAITATVLGLVEPGEEVIVLEPYYDAYAAAIALADATRVPVPLQPCGASWDLDVEAIAAAITERTAMIIINSPHNPTGAVFSRPALEELARLCEKHNLLVLADEVYENLVFNGAEHTRFYSLPGMSKRTVWVNSAAKSYNCTGWKTGWAIADPELLDGIIKAKQFMTFVGFSPVQPAVAHALLHEDAWVQDMVAGLKECHDILVSGLRYAGFPVHETKGTYYVVADVEHTGMDGIEFCTQLPATRGVAAIPLAAFCDEPEPWKYKVRFAFCKRPEVIHAAVERLLN